MEERCLEADFSLGDETQKIFLNTKGENPEETDEELIHFLKYVENSTGEYVETTDSVFLNMLHDRIVEIKDSREWEERYMFFEELLADEKAEGLREGRNQIFTLVEKMKADGKEQEVSKLFENQKFFETMLEKYQVNTF